MFGGPGGDAGGSYSLEFSKPSKSYGVKPPCSGEPSFDASFEPIRLTCADKTYAVYLLRDDINAVLGPAGDFRPLKDAAATLIDHHHKRLAEPILNEAYHRGERVEVLITLGDTDIGDYWKMSYDVLTDEEKKRVRDGLRRREGQSKLRDQRLK